MVKIPFQLHEVNGEQIFIRRVFKLIVWRLQWYCWHGMFVTKLATKTNGLQPRCSQSDLKSESASICKPLSQNDSGSICAVTKAFIAKSYSPNTAEDCTNFFDIYKSLTNVSHWTHTVWVIPNTAIIFYIGLNRSASRRWMDTQIV